MARLYVVGTPIGNREDLTPRAARILSSVPIILCEDTRVTHKILVGLTAVGRTISLHQHSTDEKLGAVLAQIVELGEGAYVSDAGTPNVADPGGRLVAMAHERGIEVVAIPGPSAVAAALSICGFPADHFQFLGFLPHKKGRETLFRRIAETEETVVLYESPHRLLKTLDALQAAQPLRLAAVCRELTKIHESVIRGTLTAVRQHFIDHPDEVRGEIVIIVSTIS